MSIQAVNRTFHFQIALALFITCFVLLVPVFAAKGLERVVSVEAQPLLMQVKNLGDALDE